MSESPGLPTGIHSYILRLWQEGPPEAPAWRVSLTRIPDGERLGFADLQSAFVFLREQIEPPHPDKPTTAEDDE